MIALLSDDDKNTRAVILSGKSRRHFLVRMKLLSFLRKFLWKNGRTKTNQDPNFFFNDDFFKKISGILFQNSKMWFYMLHAYAYVNVSLSHVRTNVLLKVDRTFFSPDTCWCTSYSFHEYLIGWFTQYLAPIIPKRHHDSKALSGALSVTWSLHLQWNYQSVFWFGILKRHL